MESKRTTILVVDDVEAGRYATAKILRSAQFVVIEAATGIEALEKAQALPDLVILDINLPDIGGFEVCRRLKSDNRTASIPVLHLSATYLELQHRVAGLEGGADGYLTQPVESLELLATVKALLRLKQAEHAAAAEVQQWHATFNAISDAICLMDADGKILRINSASHRMIGRGEADIAGRLCYEVINAGKFCEGCPLPEARQSHQRAEANLWLGSRCYRVTVDPVRDGADNPVKMVHAMTDITEHQRAAIELERLATAIHQAAETIVITDPSGTIQYVNPAFETVTGYRVEEAIGRNPRILKSGKQDDAFYRTLWQTIGSGETWKGRMVNRRKDGTNYTEECTISAVRNASGAIVNYVAVKRDITQELTLQARLLQAEKMESIGRLTGGIAHDFNNLLTIVNGYADLIVDGLNKEDPLRRHAWEIRTAGERSVQLIRRLMTFTQQQITQPKAVDLNNLIFEITDMLRQVIGEHIQLQACLAPSSARVMADPAELHSLLMNLAMNARDAMPTGGTLRFETAGLDLNPNATAEHPDLPPGPYVRLAVSDTGIGMDAAQQARMFEPFFSTKERGTGLGLATVYGIVHQCKGSLAVTSEPGKGTTFEILLPTVQAPAAPETVAPPPTPVKDQGSATILLVEDEAKIRALTSGILRNSGYQVLEASCGKEALEIAQHHAGPIDLLLTDVVMPGLSGADLAEQLQAQLGRLRVVFMSGYSPDESLRRKLADNSIVFLAKPFTRDALRAKIRKALDSPRPLASILLVDDEEGVRNLFQSALDSAGYAVVTAGNGKQALAHWRQHRPDLVISDLVMPDCEGIEMIHEIRKEDPNAKILAISGALGGAMLPAAKLLGANAALIKPISPALLLETVRTVLSS